MTTLFRIEMIVTALFVVLVIFHSINRRRLRIQYSLLWLSIALCMLVVALFPGLVFWFCNVMDIQTPSNLLFLLSIVGLLLISFDQAITISKQTDQITRLIQTTSIEKYISTLYRGNDNENSNPHL